MGEIWSPTDTTSVTYVWVIILFLNEWISSYIMMIFSKVIYFLLDIVDLRCCVSFRYTAKWISYTYTYTHSFLGSFPLWAIMGFPGGSDSKESTCDWTRRLRFNPWVGKISWRRTWQPTPVFLPGESPQTKEPGGLLFTGLETVGHDWVTKHSTHRHFVK